MMTVSGSITATAVLFVLLLASATVGWMMTEGPPERRRHAVDQLPRHSPSSASSSASAPSSRSDFKPQWAKFLGPVYAIAEGFFVGAISKAYKTM